MKVLNFLPLISQEIKEEYALSLVSALQNYSDYNVTGQAYYCAYRIDKVIKVVECVIADTDEQLIPFVKLHPNGQFFKLQVTDKNEPKITEL